MRGSGKLRAAVVLVGLVAGGALAGEASGAPLAKSSFDSDAEGWKVLGDTGSGTETATHVPTGGNPGGYISIDDAAAGGVMFWRAPQSFRKQAEDAYKGSLAFSLRQSQEDNQFDDRDIVLEGGGVSLEFDTTPNPAAAPNWITYVIPLTKAGWTDVTGSPEPATGKDMKAALKSLDTLLIRAEYRTGPDVDDLDTVVLKAAPRN